jgi:hypothetical protein
LDQIWSCIFLRCVVQICSGDLKEAVVSKLELSPEPLSLKQIMEVGRCSEESEQNYVSLLGVTNQEIIIRVLLNFL